MSRVGGDTVKRRVAHLVQTIEIRPGIEVADTRGAQSETPARRGQGPGGPRRRPVARPSVRGAERRYRQHKRIKGVERQRVRGRRRRARHVRRSSSADRCWPPRRAQAAPCARTRAPHRSLRWRQFATGRSRGRPRESGARLRGTGPARACSARVWSAPTMVEEQLAESGAFENLFDLVASAPPRQWRWARLRAAARMKPAAPGNSISPRAARFFVAPGLGCTVPRSSRRPTLSRVHARIAAGRTTSS